jgi:hypothetical protein
VIWPKKAAKTDFCQYFPVDEGNADRGQPRPETTAHRAVTGSNSSALLRTDLTSTDTPPGASAAKSLSQMRSASDPVRHGKDQPVERGEMFEGDKLDTVALRLRLVGERIGHQSGVAELAQFGDDFRDAVLSRTFSAIRYLGPIHRVIRRAECRVPPAPRDKRGRSTEDIRMIHAPAPEIE